MKHFIKLSILGALTGATFWATASTPEWPTTPSLNMQRKELSQTFAQPKDVLTSCYWYWINGNVSPEGVAADVRSMKRAGINRAFIGFQGFPLSESPRGPVYIQTPEWYKCVHSAMKTASEEGVEIGVFNCPGWSQSGGPWVKPEQSQRYLDICDTVIKIGRKKPTITLQRPSNWLSDVAILAYPKVKHTSYKAEIKNKQGVIDIVPKNKDLALRSAKVEIERPIEGDFIISAYINNNWKELKRFHADRTNLKIEVGYDTIAPTVVSIPTTKAEKFRVEYNLKQNGPGATISLSDAPVVEAYPDKILAKMFQTPLPFWEQYKWEKNLSQNGDEYLNANEVRLLTPNLDGDQIHLDLPKGEWVIARAFMAPTGVTNAPAVEGDGLGLEIDKWNPEVLQHHYNSFIGDLRKHIPAEDRKSWKVIVSDSYERATQNMGDDFIEYFKENFGYDPTPYLLCYKGIVVNSPELSDRFLWDMRRMLADRLAKDHIGGLRKLANKDGMKLWLEPYGHWGYPGEFLMYGGYSDEVSGEFWSEGSLGDIENRAASSVAHTYGKGKCSAESFTVGGPEFTRSPRTYKERGDRFFAEGINSTLLHLMISQPDSTTLPGLNAWFGNEFNRKNTWYDQMHLFTDYLKRCNLMLQQGNYVADVAYFIGEDAPVMTGTRQPEIPTGHQFDYINAEVIEKTLIASADHRLKLPHGTEYRLLVLPPLTTIRPELLQRIKSLIEDGAIVIGKKPTASPSLQNYPACDDIVASLANEMWGKNPAEKEMRKIGKGFLLSGYTVEEAFELTGVKPDFITDTDANIHFAHTSSPTRDIYFVANQTNETQKFNADFRAGNHRQPELWNAVDGTSRKLPLFTYSENRTAIPMELKPMESAFIVFEHDAEQPANTADLSNYPTRTKILDLPSQWRLHLESPFNEKRDYATFGLGDLSLNSDTTLQHFSGKMIYTTSFNLKNLPKDQHLELNLGEVREMAKVTINGKYVGGVWTAPYTLDVTNFLHKGENKIVVEVVNNWNNRLVGDLRLPESQRKSSYFFKYLKPNSPLQSAGLMGPVTISSYKD